MLEEYLKAVLTRFDWFKSDKQLAIVIGYDAANALLSNLRDNCFPMVLLEDLPEGNLSFEDGFLNNRVISLWIVEKCPATDTKKQAEVLRHCFGLGKEIIKHIVTDGYATENIATDFDRSNTPYFPRGPIGQHCWGYEFMLTFHTDIDMTV